MVMRLVHPASTQAPRQQVGVTMSLATSVRVSITAALVLALSISGVAHATAPSIDPDAAGKIEGSGATFPWNQYKDWFASFKIGRAHV